MIGRSGEMKVFESCNDDESWVNDQCVYCGVEGCESCDNGTCTSCNETKNEVVDGTECV